MKGIYDLCHRHPSFFFKIKGETDMSLEREKVDLYILKKLVSKHLHLVFCFFKKIAFTNYPKKQFLKTAMGPKMG
jgi:hypothetical protein